MCSASLLFCSGLCPLSHSKTPILSSFRCASISTSAAISYSKPSGPVSLPIGSSPCLMFTSDMRAFPTYRYLACSSPSAVNYSGCVCYDTRFSLASCCSRATYALRSLISSRSCHVSSLWYSKSNLMFYSSRA